MTERSGQDWQQPPNQQQYQPQPQRPPAPTRRKPRIFMWVILAINGLFLWWLIVGLGGGSGCAGRVGSELDACQTGEAIGTGVAAFLLIGLWAFVDIILGVVYLVTRKR